MTAAEIAEIVARLDVIEAATKAMRESLQARVHHSSTPVMPPPATVRKRPTASPRWELAARAFRRFPLEAHTVRRICSAHPEWAVKFTGGVWHVDADKFDEFAARVEAGQASFAVSAMSAKSVASESQLVLTYDADGDTQREAHEHQS